MFEKQQSGFISVSLLLLIPLLLMLSIGGIVLGLAYLKNIKAQSNLDICAEKFAASREKYWRIMESSNAILKSSRLGIYAARGASIFTAGISEGSESILQPIHQSTFQFQEATKVLFQAKEALLHVCQKTFPTARQAFCQVNPELGNATLRQQALFPDLYGDIEPTRPKVYGTITCTDLHLITEIKLNHENNKWKREYTK